MKGKLDKIKARWLRYWHCLWMTFWRLGKDHRMETGWIENPIQYGYHYKETTYIGCSCGKTFYGIRPSYMESFEPFPEDQNL